MKDLSVIIPSLNGSLLLEKYLPAVIRETGAGEVIVVDDGSDDNTEELISSKFPTVRYIRRASPNGFCYAVNEGAVKAEGRFLLVLNNDVSPSEGAFRSLVNRLSAEKADAYAIVPSIIRPDGTDESRVEVRLKRGLATVCEPGKGGIPYPSGACSLYRRKYWKELAGFDTDYAPIYWEDADLGARAFSLGLRLIHDNSITVNHCFAATMGMSCKSQILRERNRFIFAEKHFRTMREKLEIALWMPVHIVFSVLKKNRTFLRAYSEYRHRLKTLTNRD